MKIASVTPDKYHLPIHIKKYIESELKLYRTYVKSLEELQKDYVDLLHRGRQISLVPGGNGEQDKTGMIVAKLREIEEKSMNRAQRIEAIENGLSILSDEERKLVEARYFEYPDFSDELIMSQLHYGYRNTYYEIKKRALYKFAVILALI